jgi:hypothetical protein
MVRGKKNAPSLFPNLGLSPGLDLASPVHECRQMIRSRPLRSMSRPLGPWYATTECTVQCAALENGR